VIEEKSGLIGSESKSLVALKEAPLARHELAHDLVMGASSNITNIKRGQASLAILQSFMEE
jgi:hypothetical protein